MAIVKLNYTRKAKAIKAHLRYITHRPGRDGERITRSLFDRDGQKEKLDAYMMFDEARRGTIFFKIVISPDPKKEDTNKDLDLWRITSQTLSRLEERLGMPIRFIATEHNDHTPNRHVHAIFLLNRKLSKADLSALRSAATEASSLNRQSRDLVAGNAARHQGLSTALRYRPSPGRYFHARSFANKHLCQRCLAFYPMQKIGKTMFECPGCKARYVENNSISQSVQEVGWEL